MDRGRLRAEQLLTLSSAARRIGNIVAVAGAPVRYETLRHLLRVSEETMTEVLEEAVAAQLVKRAGTPFTYEPHDPETGAEIATGIGEERAERMRVQIARAARNILEG